MSSKDLSEDSSKLIILVDTYTQLMQSLGYFLKKNPHIFLESLILFGLPSWFEWNGEIMRFEPSRVPTLPGSLEWTGSGIIGNASVISCTAFCFLNFTLCVRIRIRKNSSKITNLWSLQSVNRIATHGRRIPNARMIFYVHYKSTWNQGYKTMSNIHLFRNSHFTVWHFCGLTLVLVGGASKIKLKKVNKKSYS